MSSKQVTLENVRRTVSAVRTSDSEAGRRMGDLAAEFGWRGAQRLNGFRHRRLSDDQREERVRQAWSHALEAQPVRALGREEVKARRREPSPDGDNGTGYFNHVVDSVALLENLALDERGVVEEEIDRRARTIEVGGETGILRSAADIHDWLTLHSEEVTVTDLEDIRQWCRVTAIALDDFVQRPDTFPTKPYDGPPMILLNADRVALPPDVAETVFTSATTALAESRTSMRAVRSLHAGALDVEDQVRRRAVRVAGEGGPVGQLNARRANRDHQDASHNLWTSAPLHSLVRRASAMPDAAVVTNTAVQNMLDAAARIEGAVAVLSEAGVQHDVGVSSRQYARLEDARDHPGGPHSLTPDDLRTMSDWIDDASQKLMTVAMPFRDFSAERDASTMLSTQEAVLE